MTCPLGTIATKNSTNPENSIKTGATHSEDGCELVPAGLYSPGGSLCTALPMACPAGSYAAKVGAHSAQDGCRKCGYGF